MTTDTLDASMGVTHYGGPTLRFVVYGEPKTAGSRQPAPIKVDGKIVGMRTVESGEQHVREAKAAWRQDVRAVALDACDAAGWQITDNPLEVTFVMIRKRPSAHLTTGRAAGLVKDWARDLRPTTRPDALKLARAVEDALTGIVWADDSQIVDERLHKVFGDQCGGTPKTEGMIVVVRPPWAGGYEGPTLDTVV